MKFLITVPTLLLTAVCLFAQVSNVRVQQRTDGSLMVDIYYDFINPNGYDTEIAVMASNDNGVTWELACSSSNQTGDVGEDISAGTDKHIVWDFYADNPNTSGSQFKVRVLYYFYDTMTGNDGTVYKTVKIGNQWWMAENLRETKYRDGSEIVLATHDWMYNEDAARGIRCVYNNNESNAATYGYLYNWYAAAQSGIAPEGWHVPTDEEWNVLESYLEIGGPDTQVGDYSGYDGQGAKFTSAEYWDRNLDYNSPYFNISRFSAVPGGKRWDTGEFNGIDYDANFWTATSPSRDRAWYRSADISYYHSTVDRLYGFSIRLVKD